MICEQCSPFCGVGGGAVCVNGHCQGYACTDTNIQQTAFYIPLGSHLFLNDSDTYVLRLVRHTLEHFTIHRNKLQLYQVQCTT